MSLYSVILRQPCSLQRSKGQDWWRCHKVRAPAGFSLGLEAQIPRGPPSLSREVRINAHAGFELQVIFLKCQRELPPLACPPLGCLRLSHCSSARMTPTQLAKPGDLRVCSSWPGLGLLLSWALAGGQ